MLTTRLFTALFALLALVWVTELRAKPAPLAVRRLMLGAVLTVLYMLSHQLGAPQATGNGPVPITGPPR